MVKLYVKMAALPNQGFNKLNIAFKTPHNPTAIRHKLMNPIVLLTLRYHKIIKISTVGTHQFKPCVTMLTQGRRSSAGSAHLTRGVADRAIGGQPTGHSSSNQKIFISLKTFRFSFPFCIHFSYAILLRAYEKAAYKVYPQ
jgi:hypothetical protein